MASKTVDLSTISFASLKKNYKDYCIDGTTFREKVGSKIKLNGFKISDARYSQVNTCALRLSYVLHLCGIHLPHIPGRSAQVAEGRRSPAFLPTLATDYMEIIVGEQRVKSSTRLMLKDMKGIILFVAGKNTNFGATGHVTLFEGIYVVDDNNQYFDDQRIGSIWYWICR